MEASLMKLSDIHLLLGQTTKASELVSEAFELLRKILNVIQNIYISCSFSFNLLGLLFFFCCSAFNIFVSNFLDTKS